MPGPWEASGTGTAESCIKAIPHNLSAAFAGYFPPIRQFEKLEIHTVFLHFSNFALEKNPSANALAKLCGNAQKRKSVRAFAANRSVFPAGQRCSEKQRPELPVFLFQAYMEEAQKRGLADKDAVMKKGKRFVVPFDLALPIAEIAVLLGKI